MPLLNTADKLYLGTAAADAAYLGTNKVWPPAPAGPTSKLLLTYTPGSDRNDFDGAVGVRYGIGAANITFTWMGVRCLHAGDTGPRTLDLYEWFSAAIVRTGTVDLTGKVPGEWAWVAVPSTTMLANGYYALLMRVTAGMQLWANPGPVTLAPSIVNIYDSYLYGGLQTGLSSHMFQGLDVGW
jgi:hypothetical protein